MTLQMSTIAAALGAFDFSSEGAGITLAQAPLAGPDSAAIKALFGVQSLADTQLDSPDPSIWGGITSTYIMRIDVFPPNKAAAKSYLAGVGPDPGRYAKV